MSGQLELTELVGALPQLIAALAFFWGIIQYFRAEKDKRETRRLEAKKPFLELQLKLYSDICHTAAVIVSSNLSENSEVERQFYELFWGRMPLVEDAEVESAMIEFEKALTKPRDSIELQKLSLKLAHSCRNSLSKSWGTKVWRSHYLPLAFEGGN